MDKDCFFVYQCWDKEKQQNVSLFRLKMLFFSTEALDWLDLSYLSGYSLHKVCDSVRCTVVLITTIKDVF